MRTSLTIVVGIALLLSGIAYAKPDAVPGVGCAACHNGPPTKKALTEKAAAMLAQHKDLNKCKECHSKGEGGKMATKAPAKPEAKAEATKPNAKADVAKPAMIAAPGVAASDCASKAVGKDGKPLAGAAKAAFMKKCGADAKGGAGSGCAEKAVSKDGKPLAGAAKALFMKKCEAGAKGGAGSGCAEKAVGADSKPLLGAAKASFMKKCEADAKGAK